MINAIKILGIVLARGGSKGIPAKNVIPLKGTPLIGWTLRSAVKSGVFDRLIVSTDDETIAKFARRYGGEVPFMRPAALASDKSPSIDSVIHALNFLKAKDSFVPDFVFLLQPTSPFRSIEDIRSSVDLIKGPKGKNFDALVGMVAVDQHPCLMYRRAQNGLISPVLPRKNKIQRRQDMPQVYAVNGAIYICRTSVLLKTKTFYPSKTCGFLMPIERSVDIDSPLDLKWAEFLLTRKGRQ